MTDSKWEALYEKWIRILRLQDWEVVLKTNVPPDKMALKDSAGCATFDHVSKRAVIEIADPQRYENGMPDFIIDWEQVLVHEMMHLKLALLDDYADEESVQSAVVHQLVDELAKSLVAAYRESTERKCV